MSRADRRLALLLALLAAAVHAPGLAGGFVYDDHRFVVQNAALDRIEPLRYLTDPATASASEGIRPDVWRPLRTLSFAVDRALFGGEPFFFHLGNVLLHALGVALAFRLLRPLAGPGPLPAAAGAALLAVHPSGVEVVAFISSRGDLLAVVLLLAALLVLERRGAGRTAIGAALFALALLAKEVALVLPAILLLRDLALGPGAAPPRRTTVTRIALLGALGVVYLAARGAVLGDLAQAEEFVGGSRAAAARASLAGLAWYARALLWPSGFPFDVHLDLPLSWGDPGVVVGLGLLATLLLAGARGLARGPRLLAFATLGALALWLPTAGILVPIKAVVAERFLYPVLLAVGGGVALGMAGGVLRLPPGPRRAALAASVALLALLSAVSVRRTLAWADDLTLWETVLRERPSHARAYEGLAFEAHRRGRLRDAEIAYRSYLEYNPADGKAWRLLGDVMGEAADALQFARLRPGEQLTAEGRHLARAQQIDAYGRALRVWERVGLVTGRGSPRMVRETWERVHAAALDLGDLARARDANDALLALEGVDPAGPAEVHARASPARRRARLDLALRAAATEPPRGLSPEAWARRAADRAAVVRDVGIDPLLPDEEVLRRLLPRYRSLAAEPGADLAASLAVVGLLDRLGQRAEAERLLEDLRRRHPGDPRLGDGR